MRLGIVSTHLIQYFSPLYRELAKAQDVHAMEVFYLRDLSRTEENAHFDPGFGQAVTWDLDLTSGYDWASAGLADAPFRYSVRDVPQLVRATRRWAASFKPDVVLVPGWTPAYFIVAMTLRAGGVRLICRPEARSSPRGRRGKAVRDLIARRFVRMMDGFATIGSSAAEELRRLGADPEACFASPYVVDDQWWTAQAELGRRTRTSTRSSWGVEDNRTVYLMAGKLAPYKNPRLLIESFAAVHDADPQTHLVIVGDGELRSEVDSLVATRDLASAVTMLGFQNQGALPTIFTAADVFMLVSEETWGLVANEAMACGVPLAISTAAGCSRDLVLDGVTGYRLPIAQRDELVRRLLLMADPETRRLMKSNLALVQSRFTIEVAAQGIRAAARHALRRD